MNNWFDQSKIELEVSNFGPIVEAKIELRPLTVLVGPNNTGKSYLATLIYALHRYFSSGSLPGYQRFSRVPFLSDDRPTEKLDRKSVISVIELAERMLEGKSALGEGFMLPASVVEIIRSGLARQGKFICDEIGRCFGIEEVGKLTREGSKTAAQVAFRKHNAHGEEPIDHRLTISAQRKSFSTIIPEGTRVPIGIRDGNIVTEKLRIAMEMISQVGREDKKSFQFAWMLLEALTDHTGSQLVAPLDLPAYYLPADRTGMMRTHHFVASALIQIAKMTGQRHAARVPMLSGVLADFIQQLVGFGRASNRRSEFERNLGEPIEKTILNGSVGVGNSEAIEYPHFTYRPDGWKDSLSLMHASSMVSELAPVVLYLRHMVRPNNVLIIEEPESHLHPAMQVEFIRQIVTLVKKGIRIIVTTHSDWVLQELANIVRRSGLNETATNDIALYPDQVGAWLFKEKNSPKGSILNEVKLDDDTGLYPTDFDAVSEELYNDNVKTFNHSQNTKAK